MESPSGSPRSRTVAKFHEVSILKAQVILRYGEIGTAGMAFTKIFKSEEAAREFFQNSLKEKEDMGYLVVEEEKEEDATKPAAKSSGVAPPEEQTELDDGGGKKTSKSNKRKAADADPEISRPSTRRTSTRDVKQKSDPVIKSHDASISGRISLAKKWDPSINPTGWMMSEKLDGMRAYWSGKGLWSRNGNRIFAPQWFTENFPSDVELDGELFVGRGKFDECMSVARRTDYSGDWEKVRLLVHFSQFDS